MFSIVHCLRPHKANIELPFGEEPECIFGSLSASVFTVEHEVHAIDAELFCETDHFLALFIGHATGHDGEGRDTETVEVDDVVEAFNEDQSVLLNKFAVVGLLQAAGVLAEEFLTAMEAFRETVLHRCGSCRSFRRRQANEVAIFLFVVGITSDPGKHFAVFGKDRVNDLASQADAAFVAAVHVLDADSPFCHRFRREARMASDVTRRCRWHLRNVDDALLIERR